MVSHKGGDTMAADGSVVIQIIGDDKEFKSSLGSLGNVATSALKSVATAVTAASTAIAGLAAGAAKVGSEFETTMAATSTMFGDVAVDTDGLTSKVLELSNSTGVAASEINASLYDALSSGIPVTEDMSEAMDYMKSSVVLAAAGFTDVNTATMTTAKVMNAYGMTVDDVDKINKVLIQTQNKGITTVDELGSTLAQVTPTAAAMGVSFENLGAALATMTAQGTPTAQATTQLNGLIAELGKSGTEAAKNLDKATQGTEYAGKSFKDLMDAGVPLNKVLDLMGAYADKNGLSMIDMFSSIDAGKAALSIAGDNSANFADNLAAMSTEADVVGEAYAKVTDTLETKVKILKESVSNLGIAAYKGISDPLKAAAGKATEWVGEITDAFTKGGLDGAVGAIGNVLAEAVTYVAGLAPKMIDAGTKLLQSLLTGIQNNIPALAEGAVGIVTSLVNGILTLLPQLTTTAIQLLAALVNGIAAALPTLIPAAVGAVAALVQGLYDNLPALINAALQLVLGLANGIIAAIPVLLEALPKIIESMLNYLLGAIPQIIEAGIQLLTALVTALPQIITTIVTVLPQIINGIITALLANLPLIVKAGIDLLVALIQALPEIITTIVMALPQIINGIVDALANNIPAIVNCGIQLLTALIENLPYIIATVVSAVPQIVAGIIDGFLSLAGDISDVGVDIVKGVWEGIKSMASWISKKVKDFFGGIVSDVKGLLGIHSPSTVFAGIGGNTILGFAKGFEKKKSGVLKAASSLSDELAEALSTDAKTQFDAEVSGIYGKMRVAVDAETAAISANAATQAESGATSTGAYSEFEPFDPAGVITEIRQLKAQVAKGSTLVMDKRVVAQTVTDEQYRVNRATGR